MKRIGPFFAGFSLAVTASLAPAAELSMSWRDQPDGERVIELEVGQEAVIDVRLTLSDGDTLSGLIYFNEPAENLVQAGTTPLANDGLGWDDGSVAGTSLGTGGQQVVFAARGLEFVIEGPAEVLVGSQTVRLIAGAAGEETEIVFSLDVVDVVDAAGGFYTRTPTGSASQDEVGFFHIAAGSPGYGGPAGQDAREPLVVRVAVAGGDPGNGNDNTNGGGVTDTDQDGVPDEQDAFPDDPGETADTDADGVGDNADADDDADGTPDEMDAFPQHPDEAADTDGDGTGDNADLDDDADGVPDEDDSTPLGNANGNGGSTPRGGTVARGPCGFGVVGAMPIGLAGWFLLLRVQSSRFKVQSR